MSSPAPPPETSPPAKSSPPLILPPGNPVTPPTPLPRPPTAVIASSPLLSPPAPPLTPSPDPSPVSPATSPSLPSLPSIPLESPPQPPLISPPAPALTTNPSSPLAPAKSTNPPSPLAPALSTNPSSPPSPALSIPPPAPEFSSKPPAPAITSKPEPPTRSSTPATATPSYMAPHPPETTKPSRRWRHSARSPASSSSRSKSARSRGSKPLPRTISRAPTPAPAAAEPVGNPTSQPSPGGGGSEDMPLTAEKPAPQPSVPLEVGGGPRPAMAVLPVGANGGSNIQAGTAGRGGGAPTAGVSTGIMAGLCVGGVLLVALSVFGILLVFCKRRKKDRFDDSGSFACNSKSDSQGKLSLPTYTKRNTSFPDTQIIGSIGSANSASTMPLVSVPLAVPSAGTFTYEELVSATNGFSESNLLGQGGFGYVHKGVLPNGKEVAVKQLKMGGQQGEREFRAEVETISQVHHKHLVSLVGYCIAGAERLLVYEFVPNQTMDFHLHGKDQPVMDWSIRLKIAIGSAKGLAYLHEDCNPTIIHRDIKAANILLDFNCEVKVSDFGLAKIFTNTNSSITHITTRVVGTFGYLAPEYASSGKVTDKSDVYSYGVMLLELITGRPPIDTSKSAMNGGLVNWARPLLPKAIEEGIFDTLVDPRLQKNYNVDEMANMVACAAACVRLSAWRRPRMSQVIRALEGDLSPSDLDDGVRPGHSSLHYPYESSDFDAQKYMEDMRKLRMTLSSNSNEGDNMNTTGRYSDNTSEYGLQPSISSADSHELNTRSFQLGRD